MTPDGGLRRTLIRRAAPPAVLLVTGVAILIVWGDDGVWAAAGFFLVGVAAVVAVSLVFYEVGLSEDRERARDAAALRARGRPDADTAPERPPRPGPHRTAPPDDAAPPRRSGRPPRRRQRGDDD